uniref:Uncharacterized protein n=1 Tax=Oryza brachyantha TaxID=4533 RepID=J3MCZ0_ORYBR
MEEAAEKRPSAVVAKTTLKTLLEAFDAGEDEPPTSEGKKVSRASSVASSARRVKKPTTLLDAYEVDCIRRELESLIVKHNAAGVGGGGAKNANPKQAQAEAPPTNPAKKKVPSGEGVRWLGRHAVAVCGVSVPVSAVAKKETAEPDDAKSDQRRRQHHHHHHHHQRSSSKTTGVKNANHAQASPPSTPAKKLPPGGGVRLLGRHAVAVCGVSVPVPVSSVAGGRRRRRGGHREVEKV